MAVAVCLNGKGLRTCIVSSIFSINNKHAAAPFNTVFRSSIGYLFLDLLLTQPATPHHLIKIQKDPHLQWTVSLLHISMEPLCQWIDCVVLVPSIVRSRWQRHSIDYCLLVVPFPDGNQYPFATPIHTRTAALYLTRPSSLDGAQVEDSPLRCTLLHTFGRSNTVDVEIRCSIGWMGVEMEHWRTTP